MNAIVSGEPNNEEWIQFDLGVSRSIYGVVTKGRADYQQWVTSYKVQYSAHNSTEFMTFSNVVGDEEVSPPPPKKNIPTKFNF